METILRNLLLLSMTNAVEKFDSSKKIFSQIAKNYFSNETVLVLYWTNQTVDMDVRFLVNFDIFALEFCNLDRVDDGVRVERSHIENTVIFLYDKILNDEMIKAMRNCKSWNSQSKIVVVVENMNKNSVKNLLQLFWTATRAINVTVMSINPSSVKFYTLQPYKQFTMQELQIKKLFLNKIPKNFHGSVIYAVTASATPFVFIPDGIHNFDGIEIRIINEISKRLNFRIEYVEIPNGEIPWISMRINGRQTGSLGLIDRLEAEILIHGMPFSLDKYLLGDVIAIHTIDELFWIAPFRPFDYDWKGLFDIFKFELWAVILMSLILISLIVYIITKPGYNLFTIIDAFFQVLAGLLYAPIFYYHDGYLYRIFMIIFSFYTLIITSSYQSSLITFLTTPQEGEQYKTLEEAVDDGLVAHLYRGVNYNSSNHNLWNKILSPGRHVYSMDYDKLLETIHYNKTMFGQGSSINLKYRSNEYFRRNGVRLTFMKIEELSEVFYVAMMISKGHPLRELLGVYVMRMRECGLLGFWAKIFVMDKGKEKVFGSDEPVPLALVHLHGVVFVNMILLGFAGVVFVCEVVYGRREEIFKRLRFKGKVY